MKKYLIHLKRIIKYLLSLYRVEVKRPYEIVGSEYGSWAYEPTDICSKSIVYSFGVGEDISFDLEVIKRHNCHIYAFDPTPKAIAFIKRTSLPEKFHFFSIGLSNVDGEESFFLPKVDRNASYSIIHSNKKKSEFITCPVKKLETIISEFNHDKIDILKLDIEGAEFKVLEDIIDSKIYFKQLLVEFHNLEKDYYKLKFKRLLSLLKRKNYRIFYISPNLNEYSFIKLES